VGLVLYLTTHQRLLRRITSASERSGSWGVSKHGYYAGGFIEVWTRLQPIDQLRRTPCKRFKLTTLPRIAI